MCMCLLLLDFHMRFIYHNHLNTTVYYIGIDEKQSQTPACGTFVVLTIQID